LFSHGLLVPALPTLTVPLLTGFASFTLFFQREGRERRRLARAVGTYLPRPALNRILDRLDAGVLEGESLEIVAVFSDVANYTAISELLTPTGVVALLNRHFAAITDAAVAEGGWIEGFVADLVVTYWPVTPGSGIESAADAERAAWRAAHGMLASRTALLADLDQVLGEQHVRGDRETVLRRIRELFDYGVGIFRGPAVMGDVGSRHLRKFGVLGDTLNTASRIVRSGCSPLIASRLPWCDSTRNSPRDSPSFHRRANPK
jgi:class 3 adenylate cyclase